MNIRKLNGMYIINEVIDGYRVERKYMYYSKKESINLFKKEFYNE